MTDIALNYVGQTGDLDLTGHRLNLATGEEAIEQNVKIRLRFIAGTWFLDEAQGLPYLEDILIKSPDILLIESLFRETVRTTQGISAVTSIDVAIESPYRTLTVTFSATMDTGAVLTFSPFVIEI